MNNTEFEKIITEHRQHYPFMRPADYFKLAYQSEFGPEHIIANENEALEYIIREWSEAPAEDIPPEAIGRGLCRFHLDGAYYSEKAARLLCKMLCLTAAAAKGTQSDLARKLSYIETLEVEGMREQLAEYRDKGCPSIHHSKEFCKAYDPHYRLLWTEYAERLYDILKCGENIADTYNLFGMEVTL